MRTNTKINRHEKIAAILKCGRPVSPDDIAAVFKGTDQEGVLYRLSTNIYNIRKDGGIIKVHKEGRKVTAYQLVNVDEFNDDGRYVGKQTAAPVVQAPAPAAQVNTEQEVSTEAVSV